MTQMTAMMSVQQSPRLFTLQKQIGSLFQREDSPERIAKALSGATMDLMDLSSQCAKASAAQVSYRHSSLDLFNFQTRRLQKKSRLCTDQAAASDRIAALMGNALKLLDHTSDSVSRTSIARELLAQDVPRQLLVCLESLAFEDRKLAVRLFDQLLRCADNTEATSFIVSYIQGRPDVLEALLDGCARKEVFFHSAQLLRSCARCGALVELLLDAGAALRLLELASHKNFDISSEAFACLRELMLTQGSIAAEYAERDFAVFFNKFHSLLVQDKDYVVQRQAARLLGEMLTDVTFGHVMIKYAKSARCLQIVMNLLITDSVFIKLEAFRVFTLFVASPHRPANVQIILKKNRSGLARVLGALAKTQGLDDQIAKDINVVLELIG